MDMKIDYKYCDSWYTLDVFKEELKLLINDLNYSSNPYLWHPNDEIDNKIREYVDEELKKQSFYTAGHAEEIFIYKEPKIGEKCKEFHKIKDHFSDNKAQEIIKIIREGQNR